MPHNSVILKICQRYLFKRRRVNGNRIQSFSIWVGYFVSKMKCIFIGWMNCVWHWSCYHWTGYCDMWESACICAHKFSIIEQFTWGWNETPYDARVSLYVKDNVITYRRYTAKICSSPRTKWSHEHTQHVVKLKQFQIKLNP